MFKDTCLFQNAAQSLVLQAHGGCHTAARLNNHNQKQANKHTKKIVHQTWSKD
jgi:hypothetical protein